MVKNINESNFASEVLNKKETILVDFCAEWCGPCMKLAPILEEISNSRSSLKIARIDVDSCPNLVNRYKVEIVPTLMVFKNGRKIDTHVGYIDGDNIQKMLEKYM